MKSRSPKSQLAVEMSEALCQANGWSKEHAWKSIAKLLLTCEIFPSKSIGWCPFHDVVVYRESNDFGPLDSPVNLVRQRAEQLTSFLAKELGVSRSSLCSEIGDYWRHSDIRPFQPHNLVGNAFRSIVAHLLVRYGDQGLEIEEEVLPSIEYPGFNFSSRSRGARIDIVARRGGIAVALISVRWRFRHDRVDVVDEAISYMHAARKHNAHCKFYAVVAEFSPPRLAKILSNASPDVPNRAIEACIHLQPELLWNGLNENGRTKNLRCLAWLIDQSFNWK